MNFKELSSVAIKWLKGLLKAIMYGHVITYLRVDKHLGLVIYIIAMIWLSMWIGMSAEKTMARVEENKEIISDMKIDHAQKTVKLVGLNRISTIDKLLREKGSDVTLPERPATRIKD